MIHVISIASAEGGWRVRVDDAILPRLFASGAVAEREAKAQAARFAAQGEPVKLQVLLPDGVVAARFVHAIGPAQTPSPVLWSAPPDLQLA